MEAEPVRIVAPPGARTGSAEHRTPMAHPMGSPGPVEGGGRDA